MELKPHNSTNRLTQGPPGWKGRGKVQTTPKRGSITIITAKTYWYMGVVLLFHFSDLSPNQSFAKMVTMRTVFLIPVYHNTKIHFFIKSSMIARHS